MFSCSVGRLSIDMLYTFRLPPSSNFDSNEKNFSFSNVGKMYFKETMGF